MGTRRGTMIPRIAAGIAVLGIILFVGVQKGAYRECPDETVIVTSDVLFGSTAKSSRWYVHRVRLESGQEVPMTFGQVLRVGQNVRVNYSRNTITGRIRVNFYRLVDDTPGLGGETR